MQEYFAEVSLPIRELVEFVLASGSMITVTAAETYTSVPMKVPVCTESCSANPNRIW